MVAGLTESGGVIRMTGVDDRAVACPPTAVAIQASQRKEVIMTRNSSKSYQRVTSELPAQAESEAGRSSGLRGERIDFALIAVRQVVNLKERFNVRGDLVRRI